MRRIVLFAAVLTALNLGTPVSAGTSGIPEGFRVGAREHVVDGLEHLTLTRDVPRQVVHVARVAAGAPLALRAMVSNDTVAGTPALERTSAMCARIGCLAAVNADFAVPDTGEPVGGVVVLGELERSPNDRHHQLVVGADGRPSAGRFEWTGTFLPTDLRQMRVDGVNVARDADRLVLYTPAYGPTTATNTAGAELVLDIVNPAPPLRLGQTALVRMTELRYAQGDTPIPARGAVLSGHGKGAEALKDLWARVGTKGAAEHGLLRLESNPDVQESVGGSPILVREGRTWFSDANTDFVRGRHPRTIAGWDAAGNTLLVTVDGRQPGVAEGMTLADAARLMIGLGATEAINLDGGGSTTFVVGGQVRNRPSDRLVRRKGAEVIVPEPSAGDTPLGYVERPVTVALAIVPRTVGTARAPDPLAAPGLTLPQALALPHADRASLPYADRPAVVETIPAGRPHRLPAAAAALAVFAAALTSARHPVRSGLPRGTWRGASAAP